MPAHSIKFYHMSGKMGKRERGRGGGKRRGGGGGRGVAIREVHVAALGRVIE